MSTQQPAELLEGQPHPVRSPLESWSRERGAHLTSRCGAMVPADYGDAEAELAALEPGCGVFDLCCSEVVDLLGADRGRFLNGLVTVATRDLVPGDGVYGLVTGPKGQLISDVVISAREDRFRLILPRGRGRVVAKHFEHYIVADRVSLEATTPLVLLWIGGGGLEAELGAHGATLPASPFGFGGTSLDQVEIGVIQDPRFDRPAAILEVPEASACRLLDRLCLGAVQPVGWRAWDALRIGSGVPVWGLDFGPDCLPQETGLEDVVDFEKGCYLGQEVIARLHYRGQAPRLMRRLRGNGAAALDHESEVTYEGRAAGRIGSTDTVAGHRPAAFGLLQRRAAEPGTVVDVNGVPATVEAF